MNSSNDPLEASDDTPERRGWPVIPDLEDSAWKRQAACKTAGIHNMFPDHLTGKPLRNHIEAIKLQYCDRCPVWRDCRNSREKGDGGIYAGMLYVQARNTRGAIRPMPNPEKLTHR